MEVRQVDDQAGIDVELDPLAGAADGGLVSLSSGSLGGPPEMTAQIDAPEKDGGLRLPY